MSENYNDSQTFTSRHGKSSDAKMTMIIFLLLVLISIGLYVIFRQGSKKDSDNTNDIQQENIIDESEDDNSIIDDENEPEDLLDEEPVDNEDEENTIPDTEDEEEEQTPTTSTKIEAKEGKNIIPTGWKPIPNEYYNYTAYRPGSFYYRFFGSASMLGIDPAEIPEASSYAGLITIAKVDGTLETAISTRTSTYTGKTESIKNELNGTWKVIEGVTKANEIEDSKKAISAFTVFDGVVYMVETRANEPLFTDAKSVFTEFYKAVEFGTLDNTDED